MNLRDVWVIVRELVGVHNGGTDQPAIVIAGACAAVAGGAALERDRGPCIIVGGAVRAFAQARLKEALVRQ